MTRPPRLAQWLFRVASRGQHRAEIEDDLLDLFERRAAASGARYARARYWRE